MIDFVEYYKTKGHVFGECMSEPGTDLMYINIPKNASSWTKLNLTDCGWEIYNYHTDNLYHKHAMVVLRDPVERWLSGIAEYLYLYHRNLDLAHISNSFCDLIFDRVAFDDHTDLQVLFLQGIDLGNCTFFNCDLDYKKNFSDVLAHHGIQNSYDQCEYQHVTAHDPDRKKFKDFFQKVMEKNSKYHDSIKLYFAKDYELIKKVICHHT